MTTFELIERGVGFNCLSDAYDMGKADAEAEHNKMCETCVHKVTKADIDAVYQQGRADQKKEDNEFFNFEGAWELEKQKIREDAIEEEPRIKAFNAIYDICDDMIHETEWYDMLARQKFDEIKRIVFNCTEQLKENL